MHAPSVRVLTSIAAALGLSAETLLAEAALGAVDARPGASEAAIRADVALTDEQTDALLAVYRSYVAANTREPAIGTLPAVKAFRRVMFVLGVAGLIGSVARFRGKSPVPHSHGGWRELEGPDFR